MHLKYDVLFAVLTETAEHPPQPHVRWDTILGMLLLVGLFIWRLIVALKKNPEPQRLLTRWVVTAIVVFAMLKLVPFMFSSEAGAIVGTIMYAACAILIGLTWAPSWATIMLSPLTNAMDGGIEEPDPEPLYSGAQAKRQRGQYTEAIADVRQQLEKFPHDYTGTMLLASIQAENLNDLPGAELTVQRMLLNSKQKPTYVADALNTLADWHLKYSQDREAARQCLERIRDLFPDSMLSQAASQRLAHLAPADELIQAAQREKVAVPKGERDIGLRKDFKGFTIPEVEKDKLVERYVKQLELHPLDTEAREKLAMLYAEHYQRIDLAADQLEQLIAQPNVPAKQVARWLNMLATVYIDYGKSLGAAEEAIRRITLLFPKTAIAEAATNRLAYLKLEMKKHETSDAVQLGAYEKDLGLKGAGGASI